MASAALRDSGAAATDPLTFRGTLYVVSQANGSTLYSLKMGGPVGVITYKDYAMQEDAAVLDIGLPGMDGYEIARLLRFLVGRLAVHPLRFTDLVGHTGRHRLR